MKGVSSIFKELSLGKSDPKVDSESINTSLDFKFEFDCDAPGTNASKNKKKKKKKKAGETSVADKDGDDDADQNAKVDDSFSEFDAKANVQYLNKLVDEDLVESSIGVEKKPTPTVSEDTKKGRKGTAKAETKPVTQQVKSETTASANSTKSKKGKNKSKPAGPKSADNDDDFDAFLNECQAQNEKEAEAAAKQAKLDKKNNKDKGKPLPKDIPRFLSSKDPELDEASKLKAKYGNGKNLVAIGPRKVRDPNWTAASGASSTAPAAADGKGSATASAVDNNSSSGVTHSSVFSFSFGGL